MPRPTIDYLNARRGHSRGAIRPDRLRNPVDDRAQWESLDQWEQAMATVEATFADFRSWVRNLPPIDQLGETEAPF